MQTKISCVIIAKNEEHTIARCLESVKWMDEIIVVDTGSTDRTREICSQFDVQLFEIAWNGFGKAKQFAVEQATNDWVFSIDCDEEMTPELQKRIKDILSGPITVEGFTVKRRTFYLKRLIQHSGWNRDYPLRFFNKTCGTFNDNILHESVSLSGKKERIEEHLLHYSYPDIETHLEKMRPYTKMAAQQLADKGKKASLTSAFTHGFSKFIKMYFLQLGIFDGAEGLILAVISAFGVYLKYLRLWQLTIYMHRH